MSKILVIEDEEAVRSNIVELLKEEEFQTIQAENGRVGVKLAHQELPDLIICDIMMPELDGYQVLNLLHQDELTAVIPFIFLTAKADKTSLREGMKLGADDYLIKPFTRTELLDAINARLDKRAAVEQHAERKMETLRANLAHSLPHELNTPLSIVLMYSELLLDQGSELKWEQLKPKLERIHSSAERLKRVVENFLLYAELELTATRAEKISQLRANQTGSTKELIEAVARWKAKEANRTADLQLELEEANVKMAGVDFRKIVEELVDNAFRYSQAGTPVSVVSRLKAGKLELYITDFGRGLSAEELVHLGAYVQFDRRLYEQQGAGLGLTIARRLVELHGGQLNIESIKEKKTTVRVSLLLYS